MRDIIILSALILLNASKVHISAQSTDDLLKNDRVYVDLNQQVLVSGQSLYYKAYVTNPSTPDKISNSRVLYFEIFNNNYDRVLTWRSNIENGLTYGSVYIPDSISGGIYTLRAFTSWMRNFDPKYFYQTEIILTHLTEHELVKITYPTGNGSLLNTDSILNSTIAENNNSKLINITLPKSKYKPNEKVRIDLQSIGLTDESLNLSISVIEKSKLENLIKSGGAIKYFESNNNENIQEIEISSADYPLEDRGYILTGTILNANTKEPVVNVPVYLAKTDSLVQFKYFITSDEGKFGFLVNQYFDNHKLVLQAPPVEDSSTYNWNIDSKWENNIPRSELEYYFLTNEEEIELDNIRKTELVRKLYKKADKLINFGKTNTGTNFYFTPDYSVKPEDYEALDDFNDITENILPFVRFKLTRKGYSFYFILEEIEKKSGFPPGLFLNGIPFFNLDYITPLNSQDINYMDVCTHPIMYGSQTYYGVLSIFTHSIDLSKIIFNNPVYILDNTVSLGIPQANDLFINRQMLFFTPCIYWNPQISISGAEKEVIEFDTPNIESEYLIRINGLTSKGTPYSKIISFETKK